MSESASWRNIFGSLKASSFRRYLAAQQLSLIGVWLQATASTWLVLTLSRSSLDVGVTAAFQFGPMLVLAPHAGAIADRWPRRKIMIVTQTVAALEAGALAALTLSHLIMVSEVWALAFLFGVLDSFDSPARQGLLADLAGTCAVVSATALSDLTVTVSRIVGPALAGALVVWTGPGICYALDAGSYLVVVVSLASISLAPGSDRSPADRQGARAGLSYVRANRVILCLLLTVFVIGIFGFNSQVMFSALVKVHHLGAFWFGLVNASFGAGAIAGSFLIGRYPRIDARLPMGCAMAMACALTLTAAAPTWGVTIAGIVLLGLAGSAFLSSSAGALQLLTDKNMRGRVMALFSSGFLGTSVIGGPLMGFVIEHQGVQAAFIVAAIGCLAGAAFSSAILWLTSRHKRVPRQSPAS